MTPSDRAIALAEMRAALERALYLGDRAQTGWEDAVLEQVLDLTNGASCLVALVQRRLREAAKEEA